MWCGDVADVIEPLYLRMAERVRKSHVVDVRDYVYGQNEKLESRPRDTHAAALAT